jgi:hypothetical protein
MMTPDEIIIGIWIAIVFSLVGAALAWLVIPVKPYPAEDIKESMMMLSREGRVALLKWLVEEVL